MAVDALVNGGNLMTPTFLPRTEAQAAAVAHRVVSPQTSESMRYLLRANATHGSAGFANIPGYYVGGKTGTADKIVHGHYSQDKVFTTFMAITPADKPKYLYLVMYDEPHGLPEDGGYHTAAYNAGRVDRGADRARGAARGAAAGEPVPRPAVSAAGAARIWLRRGQGGQGVRRLGEILDLSGSDAALASREIGGLCADSRKVRPGDAFFAIPGVKSDGMAYAAQAVEKGAGGDRRRARARFRRAGVRARRRRAGRARPRRGALLSAPARTRRRGSPAPAARRRSPPSCGRSGPRRALRRLRWARSASSRVRSPSTAR